MTLPARHVSCLPTVRMALSILQWGCDISRCLSLCMVKILYWRTVWRMTQRYPVISLMITLHNMNQHSICSRRAIVNRYASGYRKVRWQRGIVGRGFEQAAWCWTRSGWGETISHGNRWWSLHRSRKFTQWPLQIGQTRFWCSDMW